MCKRTVNKSLPCTDLCGDGPTCEHTDFDDL